MGRISLGRVAAGGLLAGLIVNIGEFVLNGLLIAEDMTAAMAASTRIRSPVNEPGSTLRA